MGARASITSAIAIAIGLMIPDLVLAQGPVRASATQAAGHTVTVVVPTILTLIPPPADDTTRGWTIRSNDPRLRARLALQDPLVARTEGAGPAVILTLTLP